MKAKLRDIIAQFMEYSQRNQSPDRIQVFVADNGKAKEFIDSRLSLEGLRIRAFRAEDVPRLVSGGEVYWGVTTTEYTEEFRRKSDWAENLVEYVLPWEDDKCRYGQPALCLLGPKSGDLDIEGLTSKYLLTVAVKDKISSLSSDLAVASLVKAGITTREWQERTDAELLVDRVKIQPLGGRLETAVAEGVADLCVDIVATGETARKSGISVYSGPLFRIGLSILASKRYLS